jgi:TonB family protein
VGTNYALSEIAGATDVNESSFEVRGLSLAQSDNLRAEFLAHVGRYSDARTLLQRILRDDASNADAYATSCGIEVEEREFEEAREVCQQAAKLDPNNFLARYRFAAAAIQAGNLDKAGQDAVEEDLRTVLKLKPSFAPAYDVLAMFYANRGVRLTEARDLVEEAVQLLPGAPEARINEAQLLVTMHKDKEALEALQLALKLAHTPEQVASVESVMKTVEDLEAQRAKYQGATVHLTGKSGGKGVSAGAEQSETPPRAIYSTELEYTEEARAAKLQGMCVVRMVVGVDGKPSNVVVVKKLGMGLDEKAVEAVKKWRFEPGRKYGRPVPTYLTVNLEFKILGESTEKINELSRKASQGDAAAEFELANAFFAGREVTRDEAQGMVLLERAARSGLTDAQFQMGEHIYGDGANADKYVMAYMWYSLAQRSGTEQAAAKVGELESRMTPAQLSEARRRVDAWPDEPAK